MGRQTKKSHFWSLKKLGEPVGEKGEGRKGEKRKERREKGKKIVEQGGRCDFFFSFKLPKCFTSGIKREEPRKTKKTSKFLMVGKLDFYVFHT